MAGFEAFTIGIPELQRMLSPDLWWDALERALPDAVEPVKSEMASIATTRTGKLAASVMAEIRRVGQGLVRGVEVLFGVGVSYGHLVEEGHDIIARGPSRSGRLSRQRRAVLRSGLKARRAAGPIGFVEPRPFAQPAALGQQEQVLTALQAAVRQRLAA